jgi:hypothetical protein
MKIPDDYELTEADIDKVINLLKIIDPENATPEQAIDFLEYHRSLIHQLAHRDDIDLEDLYKKFKKSK